MKLIEIDCDTIEGLKGLMGIKAAYNPNLISFISRDKSSKFVWVLIADHGQDQYEFDSVENAEKFYNQMLECMANA